MNDQDLKLLQKVKKTLEVSIEEPVFTVICDKSNNPQDSVDQGIVNATVILKPSLDWIPVKISRVGPNGPNNEN